MSIKKKIRRALKKCFSFRYQAIVRKWLLDNKNNDLRLDYDLGQNSVVFDLGGYQGQWADDVFTKFKSNVYVFEPVQSFVESIKQRFTENDKIHIYPFGLGYSSRKEMINLSADGSTVFGESSNTEEIEILDAKEWFDKNGIEKIDLMKINIEGGEYELLERIIETSLINKIVNVQIQFHNISKDSRSRMKQIQSKLKSTHSITYQYEFVWENWLLKAPKVG